MKFFFNIFSRKAPSFEEEVEAFFKAIRKGNIAVVEKTLAKYPSALSWKSKTGDSCANIALANNQLAVFDVFLSRGMNINVPIYADPFFTDTALHWACETGKTDIARFLLDRGADATLKGKLKIGGEFVNRTPLEMAAYHEHYNIVNLFAVYAQEGKSATDPRKSDDMKLEL